MKPRPTKPVAMNDVTDWTDPELPHRNGKIDWSHFIICQSGPIPLWCMGGDDPPANGREVRKGLGEEWQKLTPEEQAVVRCAFSQCTATSS